MKTSEKIVALKIALENFTNSSQVQNTGQGFQLTVRTKTLFLISHTKNCTPSLLIERLGIVKSNLALVCKSLLTDGLIVQEKSQEDRRSVYYNITDAGVAALDEYLELVINNTNTIFGGKSLRSFEKRVDELLSILTKI